MVEFGQSDDVVAGNHGYASEYNNLRSDLLAFPSFMSRNAIINGNFDVAQRGTSFTPSDGDYSLDRWIHRWDADGGSFPTRDVTQETITPGDLPGSYRYVSQTFDGAGSSLGANCSYKMSQRIEHGVRLLCGSGKQVTLSFYAKSDITDKRIGVYLNQVYGTGGSPSSSETITGTNWTLTPTWTKYEYTFTTNTLSGKTFGTAGDDYLQVVFNLIWGSTTDGDVGASTDEDFGGAGDVDIAQVQLNAGAATLEYYPRTYGEELQLCQRYYYRISGQSGIYLGVGWARTTTQARIFVRFPVPLRITNASTSTNGSSNFNIHYDATSVATTSFGLVGTTKYSSVLVVNIGSSVLSVGQIVALETNTSGYVYFDAEL